jgi:uncharacterized membrane protein
MKTKRYRQERRHHGHATRRHSLLPRIKAGKQKRMPPPPKQQQQDAGAERSSLEIVCEDAVLSGEGQNLILSTFSDEEGSYLVMSIEVPVPFTAAYDAWIRFDEIPHFMRGTELPESHDGSRMTWRIRTMLDQFAWQARVCEQVPFDRITWKSVQGTPHPGFGAVCFEPISHLRTWIMVQVGFDLSGVYRWLGDPMPSLSRSLEHSMKRFQDCMAQTAHAVETQETDPARTER